MIFALGSFFFASTVQAQWTPSNRLTWTAGASESPSVAVGAGSIIHVVWEDATPGNHEIYYKNGKE
jgi:hypothetical protein